MEHAYRHLADRQITGSQDARPRSGAKRCCPARREPHVTSRHPWRSLAGDLHESFTRDSLAFAFRSLKRQPAFAITAVLTIALGIGATSAIFSVVNAVLLRPLPYNEAARLGTIWSDLRNRNVVDFPLPPGDFFDLRIPATLFDGFARSPRFGRRLVATDKAMPSRSSAPP